MHGPDARLVTDQWHERREDHEQQSVSRMRKAIEVVSAIRSIRGEMNVNPGKRIAASIASNAAERTGLQSQQELMMNLARLETLDWLEEDAELEAAAVAPLPSARVYLPLAGLINVEEELVRLNKNIARLDKDIARGETKLGNPKFRDNAPAEVIAKVQTELDEARAKHAEMLAAVERLKAI